MDINTLFIFIGFGSVYLFIKSYFPKYMEEKGKNIATKEDIQEITTKTEAVKVAFQKEFDEFSRENRFKNEYHYKQLSELYSKLYAIVSQSEYFRYFNELCGGAKASFEEFPFFEMVKKSSNEKSNLFTGEILERQIVKVNDSITSFNKKELSEFIIANSNLASRKLLKIAVAYRFANDNYGGSEKPTTDEKMLEEFNNEELRLIREMVKIIVSDYNRLSKELNLHYNKVELETGIFQHHELKS